MDGKLKRMLEFDPLDAVEKATGKKMGKSLDDPITAAGLAVNLLHNKMKKNYLKERDDSYMSMPLVDFVTILINEDFKLIYEEEFIDTDYDSGPKKERFNIYWHDKDGLLISFDSYAEQKRVNSVKLYYNYKPLDGKIFYTTGLPQNGYFHDRTINGIWIGSYDAREALRFHINSLREIGDFVVPWVEEPFLWFLNYMDTKDENYNYREINKMKLEKIDPMIRNKFIIQTSDYYIGG